MMRTHLTCDTLSGRPLIIDITIFLQVIAEDQDLVGMVKYGSEGVAPAPTYFDLDPDTGEITVSRDLTQDRRTTYIVCATTIHMELGTQYIFY